MEICKENTKKIRQFYYWLLETKPELDLVKNVLMPKFIDKVVKKLYYQYFFEEDREESLARIRDGGFDCMVVDWEYYEILDHLSLQDIEDDGFDNPETLSIKTLFWDEYISALTNNIWSYDN